MFKKFFGFSGLLFAIAIVFVAVTLLSRLSQFRKEVARLQDDGFPVSIADLSKEGSAAGKDTLMLMNRLRKPLFAFETEMWEYLPDEYNFDEPADDPMIAKFNELNDAYPTVFPLIEQIADQIEIETNFPGNSEEFVNALMDQSSQFRSLARVLGWRMRVAVAESKPDVALADGIRILKLSQLTACHPMLVGYLTSEAVKGMGVQFLYNVISLDDVSSQSRDLLHAELELLEGQNPLKAAMISERAFGISSITDAGTVQLAHGGIGYLGSLQMLIEESDSEDFQKQSLPISASSVLLNGWLATAVLPGFNQASVIHSRNRSLVRALRIYSALQTVDELPESVSSEFLVGLAVPEEMTVDGMTGELMIVSQQNGKLNVYSVGGNRIDDGGTSDNRKDHAFD